MTRNRTPVRPTSERCKLPPCASSLCLFALAPAGLRAQEPVRTADITVRGLKASDFPRIRKLADNVYCFEQTILPAHGHRQQPDRHHDGGRARRREPGHHRQRQAPLAEFAGSRTSRSASSSSARARRPHGRHHGVPGGRHVLFAHLFSAPKLKRAARACGRPEVVTLGGTEIDVLFSTRPYRGRSRTSTCLGRRSFHERGVFQPHLPSMANGIPTEWVAALKKAEQLDAAFRARPRLRRQCGRLREKN